jgi:hypothetical protein
LNWRDSKSPSKVHVLVQLVKTSLPQRSTRNSSSRTRIHNEFYLIKADGGGRSSSSTRLLICASRKGSPSFDAGLNNTIESVVYLWH